MADNPGLPRRRGLYQVVEGGRVVAMVTDNAGNASTNTFTISLDTTAPVANPQSLSTNENSATNGTVTGTDTDGDPVTFAIASGCH